jgi:hypothetical protein
VEFNLPHATDASFAGEDVIAKLCKSMSKLSLLDVSQCKQVGFNGNYAMIKNMLRRSCSLTIRCNAFHKMPISGYGSILRNLARVIRSFKNHHPLLTIEFVDIRQEDIPMAGGYQDGPPEP